VEPSTPAQPRREPERVLEAILAVLAANPDLRVGQAVAIATSNVLGHCDPFSIEDGPLAKALEKLAELYRSGARSPRE
jgi:hypothetical protein